MANPRIFTFAPKLNVAIPATAVAPERRTSPNALPFAGLFTSVEQQAMNGEAPFYFIPREFWLQRPNIKPANVTPAWQKAKIKAAFKAWKEETETEAEQTDSDGKITKPAVNEKRGRLYILLSAYTGKEGMEEAPEEGIGFWLKVAEVAAEEQPEVGEVEKDGTNEALDTSGQPGGDTETPPKKANKKAA